MKKAIIVCFVLIGVLIGGLTYMYIQNQKLQKEVSELNSSIGDLTTSKNKSTKDLSSRIYDLENRIESVEYSGLESRLDDAEDNIDELFRFSHWH